MISLTMIESPTFTTEEIPKDSKKKRVLKISLIILSSLLTVSLFSTVGYFLGRESMKQSNSTPTPAPPLFGEDVQGLTKPDSQVTPILGEDSEATQSATPTKSKTTPTPTSIPKSLILTSTSRLDGYMGSNETGSNTVEIKIGRNQHLVTRGFVSFNLIKIPEKVDIESVTLRIFQLKSVGDPYNLLGDLVIDHLNFGDAIDATDYALPAILSSFDTISKSKKTEWKETDVTAQVLDDISNKRSTSQFRLHFEKEVKGDDPSGDFVYFEAADNSEGTKNVPQLVIKYQNL